MYGGWSGLDRKETDGVVSVCFQSLFQHFSQKRQFVAWSKKNGEIHWLFFLHASLNQHSVEVQLQHSSNKFLSSELMEVPRLLLLNMSSALKSSK